MEIAYWPESCGENIPGDANRIYIGHETGVEQIPAMKDIIDTSHQILDTNRQITLVTPAFLSEKDMNHMRQLIEAISGLTDGLDEVVCNDWGLLYWLTEDNIAKPVIGRLLVGQATDPRLSVFDSPERQIPFERFVQHADGTMVRLLYRRPKPALMSHLRSCAIANPEVLSFFTQLGVQRLEISNVLQGIEMTPGPGWSVSLHLPEVPVALARHNWSGNGNQWLHPSFPVDLYKRNNMIFYRNYDKPENLSKLQIDRLVYRIQK